MKRKKDYFHSFQNKIDEKSSSIKFRLNCFSLWFHLMFCFCLISKSYSHQALTCFLSQSHQASTPSPVLALIKNISAFGLSFLILSTTASSSKSNTLFNRTRVKFGRANKIADIFKHNKVKLIRSEFIYTLLRHSCVEMAHSERMKLN